MSMNITSKAADALYQACIQQVKESLEDSLNVDKKHAFHESANFLILEPDLHKNPVSYDGQKFSHSKQDEAFELETLHYNQLILSDEVDSLIKCLRREPDSKKAYLSLWKNEFVFGKSGEIPCLVGIHFYIEEEKLFTVVQMRSNELLSLLPIDICFGVALQTYVADQLKLKLGSYTHQVASLILYSKDVEKLKSI